MAYLRNTRTPDAAPRAVLAGLLGGHSAVRNKGRGGAARRVAQLICQSFCRKTPSIRANEMARSAMRSRPGVQYAERGARRSKATGCRNMGTAAAAATPPLVAACS
jgi:hypothetical protein